MTGTAVLEQSEFREVLLFDRIIENLRVHGFAVTDGFFKEEEVNLLRTSLLQAYEAEKFRKSAIGDHFNEVIRRSVRGDFIHWIDQGSANVAETLFFERIRQFTTYLNRTCFMGIAEEEFHYALYPKGTFYKRHIDVFRNSDRRKLTVICYLNDRDWNPENGGELSLFLPEESGEQELLIHPFPGRVVIFESRLLEHEVKPVANGERLSITGWLKTR